MKNNFLPKKRRITKPIWQRHMLNLDSKCNKQKEVINSVLVTLLLGMYIDELILFALSNSNFQYFSTIGRSW